jgi:glutaminyl-peptide cyclotransferase
MDLHLRAARAAIGVVLVASTLGCGDDPGDSPGEGDCRDAPPERLEATVIEELPHDPDAFTQGLAFGSDGELFESTGLEGASTVNRLDPSTGEVLQSAPLEEDLFGEGLAIDAEGELVQLTWTEGRALRWDPSTLEPLGEHTYSGEGWGLTLVDPETFAMSDGSSSITLRDVEGFAERDRVTVRRVESDGSSPVEVDRLNELEWDGEHLWANRWQTDEILRIDLDCGRVDGVLDAGALRDRAAEVASATGRSDMDVLNGIAIGEDGGMLLTGKRWPLMFRVEVTEGG